MILGFTGGREFSLTGQHQIQDRVDCLVAEGMAVAVTGACLGTDTLIFRYLLERYPNVFQVVVVPANRSQIGRGVLGFRSVEYCFMPTGTSYRDRNVRIVQLSDHVEAFWNGKSAGTAMTISIARSYGKLRTVTRIT